MIEAVAALTRPGAHFEIVDGQVHGVPTRLWANAPATLVELLAGTRRRGDQTFLVYGEDRYTFARHLDAVAGLARWLSTDRGITKGDRVAIGMRNYPEWIISFWAAQVLGAVVVPLNAWGTAAELRYALVDSGATFAVVDDERYARIAPDLIELGIGSLVVRTTDQLGPSAVRWADIASGFEDEAEMPDVTIGPDDPSTIIYTSGTTGRPKGAVGTHRNHVSNFFNTAFIGAVGSAMAGGASSGGARRRACSLMTYPFFHIGGLSTIYLNTAFGVTMVLMYKWDVDEALRLIEREQVTALAAVPALMHQLLRSEHLDQYDVSSLGNLTSGGAPVPPEIVKSIDVTFSSKVSSSNGYGLTETTGAVAVNSGADYQQRPSSVGRPFPVLDVKVVQSETGAEAATGVPGELWFRGPTVVEGYWDDEAATEREFSDGWFHSGDIGWVDDEGFIYVVDRLKDMVIRAGENYYCVEVEDALIEHPAVAEVAVVGIPHPELGEEVVAVVQLRDGAEVSEEELRDHVAARLAHFKVPSKVLFRTTPLPRTATGKILKRRLRDEL